MQILTRLKKALIMVHAESNQDSCTSQSKLELNSVSFRADSIRIQSGSDGIRSGYDRTRTESGQAQTRFYWGLSEIRSGFGRDPFRLEQNLSTVQFR